MKRQVERGRSRPPSRALALIVVAASASFAISCGERPEAVATHRVEPVSFARRVTAEGTLKAVKATPVMAPQEARAPMKVAWIAEDGEQMKAGDVIVRFDSTDFENLLLLGREDRTTAGNRLEKSSVEASATRSNLERDARLAQRQLESAQQFKFDDEEIFSRYSRIESDVDEGLAIERKRHAEEVLVVREGLSRVDRDLIAIEDRKAGLKIKQAEEGLQALQVVAPHDGILVLQRNWRGDVARIGDSMWRGQPIGEIPNLAAMQADVFVLEADAAGLAVDQKVTLFLEADAKRQFTGKVKSVDKVARPRIPRQPVQYFGVTVELDETDSALMKPGARVRASLEVENQENVFVIPRQALFEKEGKRLVYRKKGKEFEPVEVTIGTSSAGRVVVTEGLSAGDEIALEDVMANDARKRP
jgi:HlyD family secretion protein